jgi:A/G-specific adenine glycosylase
VEKDRQKLYRWFRRHGRDLPWRRTRDPYAILVSEFMLQQTTVTAVVPYFERWMEAFPTLRDLANADESQVMSRWQGLGYYSRARNLHRVAREIEQSHGGRVPRTLPALRSLPGVGEYTAGAVMAFGFDFAGPVVDANIARVLARLADWRHPIDNAKGVQFLRRAAESLLPAKGGRRHTSALMELGARVCLPKAPHCGECPLQESCRAVVPERLPVKRPRRVTEAVQEVRAFVWARGKIWLERSRGPRWLGMWVMPVAKVPERTSVHEEIYPITRFRVTMNVVPEGKMDRTLSGFSPEELPPMPSPHRRAVAALLRKRHNRVHAR